MTPSAETLFAFARSRQGTVLHTVQRRTPFRVEVIDKKLEIQPSTGQPRYETFANVTVLLKEFASKGAWQASHYQELSFNASYVLALLKEWQDSGTGRA